MTLSGMLLSYFYAGGDGSPVTEAAFMAACFDVQSHINAGVIAAEMRRGPDVVASAEHRAIARAAVNARRGAAGCDNGRDVR